MGLIRPPWKRRVDRLLLQPPSSSERQRIDMPQDHPHQPSPEGSEWNVAKGQELDDLLDKACSLAHEIKREVSDSTAVQCRVMQVPEQNPESLALDRQLDEIDRLLDSAQEDIGAEAGAAESASIKPAASASDLRAELTGDAVAQPAATSERAEGDASRPGSANVPVGSGTESAKPAPAPSAAATMVEDPEDDLLALSAATPRSLHQPTAASAAAEPSPSSAAADRSLFTRTVADPLVTVLTLMNRPFDRLGMRTRTYIGYAALFMLLAAAVVFAISLV